MALVNILNLFSSTLSHHRIISVCFGNVFYTFKIHAKQCVLTNITSIFVTYHDIQWIWQQNYRLNCQCFSESCETALILNFYNLKTNFQSFIQHFATFEYLYFFSSKIKLFDMNELIWTLTTFGVDLFIEWWKNILFLWTQINYSKIYNNCVVEILNCVYFDKVFLGIFPSINTAEKKIKSKQHSFCCAVEFYWLELKMI